MWQLELPGTATGRMEISTANFGFAIMADLCSTGRKFDSRSRTAGLVL